MSNQPEIISGAVHADQRGSISFINDFTFADIKRFYTIEPADSTIARAWQGHRHESKWFHVIAGSFKVVAVKIDNWENPSDGCELFEYDLSAGSPAVLHIPGGYANGFKALESGSRVMIFSDFTVQQSIGDDYRYDQNKWYNWNEISNTI
ncbi:WxcM-like domain-containing protein [Mucilaginibacter sp. BT774]|uniref:WxcM-like domain-containing protein n=1 Tax=Mucilaginibacter sp. BT774 TaxID=3062276 RepID=UPI00267591BC|nr:WxcM-like domain-containing protein [Mucilaginibacter sp. BT774]MDO3625936.1 WxcM-like domain-containing protein [Mucilaginibacter sp. BT774]